MSHLLPAACLATALTMLAAVAAPGSATHGTAPPDAVFTGVWVDGFVFHDFLGMCHLGAACPFPWAVPGNYVGACLPAGPPVWDCSGAYVDLWFQFTAGGGAVLQQGGPAGPVVGGASGADLIHVRGFAGDLQMACGFGGGATDCVTDFRGAAVLVELWDF